MNIRIPIVTIESRFFGNTRLMHLKIGELSKKTSCSVLTIRFYEKEGLIPEPERTEGNYRLYDIGYVERIKFILNCRTLNMSLNEIRQLLTYKDKPEKNCSDVNELIDLLVCAIKENIIKQQKLIEQLSDLRGTCDGLCTIDQCGVLKNLA